MDLLRSSLSVALSFIMVVGVLLTPGEVVSQEQSAAIDVNGKTVERSVIKAKIDRMVRQIQQQKPDDQKSSSTEQVRQQAKQRVIDQTVNQLVLLTHAKQKDVDVDDQQVDKRLQETIDRFPSEDEFERTLKQQDMDREQLRNQFREGLLVQNFVKQQVGEISVSDKQARSIYEKNKQRYQNRDFEQVKTLIKRSVKQQKKRQARQQLVSELKEDSDINVMI